MYVCMKIAALFSFRNSDCIFAISRSLLERSEFVTLFKANSCLNHFSNISG